MSEAIDSARLKLTRAAKHFNDLNGEIDAFMRTEPYAMADDLEIDGDWYVAKVRVASEPPLILALIAGDVLGNVRAALDHLVYALSITKSDGTGFPIFIDEKSYLASHRERLLAGVPDTERALIDGFQPYTCLKKTDPLWLLREFNNADKHRVIQPALGRPRNARVGKPLGAQLELGPPPQGPIHDGAEVLRFRFVGQEARRETKVATEIDMTIGFGDRMIDTFDIEAIRDRADEIARRLG